jgi:sugar phosphate isomerase/epimerase
MTGPDEHHLRFAYSTINWGATCDIPQALRDIEAAGWSAVELFGHSLDLLGTPSGLQDALGSLVPATMFAGLELPDTPTQHTRLRNQIRFASEIGAQAFGLVGGSRLRWRPPSSEEYAGLAQMCDDLAHYGASAGVAVSYHPHTSCTVETSREIAILMERTTALKLCLDASHIALVGEDPGTVIDTWWDRLGYLHLKDWGRGKFAELGQGAIGIDFPAILQMLVDRRFTGWVVIEQSQSEVSALESARVNAHYLVSRGYPLSLPGSAAPHVALGDAP